MATTMARPTARRPAPARYRSRGDLSGAGVVSLAFLALGLVTWLDLTDGSLGIAFSVGFVLTVLTAPMAVSPRSLVTTGVLPPVLLITTLLAVVMISPEAVPSEGLDLNAGTLARTIAATLDHGFSLVIGHALALAAIAVRSTWGVRAADRRYA